MIVVDSSAIIAILKQEPDAASFARVFVGGTSLLMSAGTFLECGLVVRSRLGDQGMKELIAMAAHIRLEVVPVDEKQALIGIEAFRRYGRGSGHRANLNFGDCFAYAISMTRSVPLLFKGDNFVHTDVVPALPA
jgi:ribonuclease VapC